MALRKNNAWPGSNKIIISFLPIITPRFKTWRFDYHVLPWSVFCLAIGKKGWSSQVFGQQWLESFNPPLRITLGAPASVGRLREFKLSQWFHDSHAQELPSRLRRILTKSPGSRTQASTEEKTAGTTDWGSKKAWMGKVRPQPTPHFLLRWVIYGWMCLFWRWQRWKRQKPCKMAEVRDIHPKDNAKRNVGGGGGGLKYWGVWGGLRLRERSSKMIRAQWRSHLLSLCSRWTHPHNHRRTRTLWACSCLHFSRVLGCYTCAELGGGQLWIFYFSKERNKRQNCDENGAWGKNFRRGLTYAVISFQFWLSLVAL